MDELGNFYKSEKTLTSSQRKKLKKKQKEYEEQLQLDEQINSKLEVGVNEYNLLEQKLKEIGLKIHNIQPDGNCLFKSVEHQLEYFKGKGHEVKTYNYHQLRKLAVENILSNQTQYQSFLTNNCNNSSSSCSDNSDNSINYALDDYCNKMLKDGEWGGELELLSLSEVLNLNISVYNLQNNFNYGSYDGQVTLKVSYHQHQYILGAHYNSLIPI